MSVTPKGAVIATMDPERGEHNKLESKAMTFTSRHSIFTRVSAPQHFWVSRRQKLGDVVQQHDYELKMLKERVTMLEDEKIAARIAALEERIAAMTLRGAGSFCGAGAAAAA